MPLVCCPVEPDLANVYEAWSSEAELMSFRQDGPSAEVSSMIAGADVRRYSVAHSGTA